MALRFFRQRQKLVMIIMVLVMLSFALSAVIPSFFQKSRDQRVRGHVGDDEVLDGQVQQASGSLSLLGGPPMNLGSFRRPRNYEVAFARFLDLNPSDDRRALAWTLLTQEAARMGAVPGDRKVNRLLAESGLTGKRLEETVANLGRGGFSRAHLYRAIGEYLAVMDTFAAVAPAALTTVSQTPEAPPSIPEMRHACKLLGERVQLFQATFSPEDYLDGLDEPTDDAIRAQFEKHKHVAPNSPDNKTEYGFGYLQPDQARIAWLLVDYDALAQAVEPAERDMLEFWTQSGEKMTVYRNFAPDTQPTSAPAIQPEFRQVVITDYAEAQPLIRERLIPQAARNRMNGLIRRAQQIIKERAGKADPYAVTVDALIAPADAILAQPVAALPEISATLKEVVERLSEASGVTIVYPYGEHDNLTLDAKLKIKLPKSAAKPLGEILKQIQTQARYPEITWVVCDGVPGAIFPVDPVNLSPISTGKTEPLNAGEIRTHKLLGSAQTDASGGQSILAIVASAAEFQRPGPRRTSTPLIEVGKEFRQPMHVAGARNGRMLWRLLEAKRQYEPKELTDRIRKQVVKDLKIVAGFKRASAAAEALLAKLPDGDFEKLTRAAEARFRDTRMLPREVLSQWFQMESNITDALIHSRHTLIPRIDESDNRQAVASIAEGVSFATRRLSQQLAFQSDIDVFARPTFLDVDRNAMQMFSPADLVAANDLLIEEAFKLAPVDKSKAPTDRPATLVTLPRLRQVVVVQRVGYDMPSEDSYAISIRFFKFLRGKPVGLKNILKAPLRQRAMNSWFKLESIIARTGYKRATDEDPSVRTEVTSRPKD